jgi:hypothetical protein
VASPRWLWFAGGALVVGIGGAAAAWYAGRGRPHLAPNPAPSIVQPVPPAAPNAVQPSPAAQPTAQSIDPPVTHPRLVEVRFDSLPSGSVFAEGLSVELCRTPCSFNIDLSDGGPLDRRGFVIKREGYVDGALTVDLTGDKREFRVMLQHAETTSPPDTKDVVKADPRLEKRLTKRPAKPPRSGRPPRPDDADGKDHTAADAAGHDAQDTRDARPPSRKDPERDHPIDSSNGPSDGQPPPTKKPPARPTIDPSDTLDPFRRK